jgi:hypothetical protein
MNLDLHQAVQVKSGPWLLSIDSERKFLIGQVGHQGQGEEEGMGCSRVQDARIKTTGQHWPTDLTYGCLRAS